MKKFFSYMMLAAVAVAAFASCAKDIEEQYPVKNGVPMKTITVKTDILTKTTLDSGHENIVWAGGEKISLFNDYNSDITEVDYSAGGDIDVQVPAATNEIYMHYPHFANNTNGPTSVSVYINNAQTQTDPGVLNGYYFPMLAKGTVSADNKALVQFYPVAGALALNIYKSSLGDSETETVESVKVTPATSNTGFYGRQLTNITADAVKYTSAEGIEDAVTVTLTHGLSLSSSAPSNKQTFGGQIYVCLAKQSYANVKFEITTDKGTYTITSNSTAFDLVNNDFVPVNINLTKAQFEEKPTAVDPTAFNWGLVKDALTVGDKVVIAAAESAVAMSTEQKTNNRGQIGITKNGTALTAVADVQVFEVVAGSESNTIALKCLNGSEFGNYIYAASSSANYLRSTSTLNANASWIVNIDSSNGVAQVAAQGTNTRNTIQYNASSSLFACYASTGTGDVVFYRAGLPSANLSFPQESYTVNVGESFTAPELSNPYSVSVTYSSSASTIAAVDASTGAVTIGTTAGKATITASFAGNSSYSATEASYDINVVDPNVEQWVNTAIADIATTDVFVIVGGGYAVTNDNGTGSAPAAQSVTISGDALSDAPDDNLKWKLTGNATNGYSFSPADDASSFLYCNTTADTKNNNCIRVGTGDRKVWEFNDNGYMITKDTYVVRYFSLYSDTPDWRGYVSTNYGAVALEFYVKQGGSSTPTKTLSSISVTAPTKTTYTVGDAFDDTGMVVTATYSDATTADVTSSATTNFTTQVATAGNKTVTVSYEEGGVTKTGTFSITVNAATGDDTKTLEFTVASHDNWDISEAVVKNGYYLLYIDKSISSPSVSVSEIKSIAITMRTFGGTDANTVAIYYGDTQIGSATTNSGSTLTEVNAVLTTTTVSGNAAFRIVSAAGNQSTKGEGISKITIKYN